MIISPPRRHNQNFIQIHIRNMDLSRLNLDDEIPIFFKCGQGECYQGRLGGIHAYTGKENIIIRRHDAGGCSGGQMPFGKNNLIHRCAATILVKMLRLYMTDSQEEEYAPYEQMLNAMRGTELEDLANDIDRIFYAYARITYQASRSSDSD